MKTVTNATLRSIFAIILGLILVIWPTGSINYLVIIIGVLFLIPGVITLISYLTRDKAATPDKVLLIDGVGSILFGLWLIITPSFFVSILMYVLGILLIIGAIQLLISLNSSRKQVDVPVLFFIIPALILICGIVILFNPFKVVESAFILFGITSIVYGIIGLVSGAKFDKQITE